jgi:hypothetical protein
MYKLTITITGESLQAVTRNLRRCLEKIYAGCTESQEKDDDVEVVRFVLTSPDDYKRNKPEAA